MDLTFVETKLNRNISKKKTYLSRASPAKHPGAIFLVGINVALIMSMIQAISLASI